MVPKARGEALLEGAPVRGRRRDLNFHTLATQCAGGRELNRRAPASSGAASASTSAQIATCRRVRRFDRVVTLHAGKNVSRTMEALPDGFERVFFTGPISSTRHSARMSAAVLSQSVLVRFCLLAESLASQVLGPHRLGCVRSS